MLYPNSVVTNLKFVVYYINVIQDRNVEILKGGGTH